MKYLNESFEEFMNEKASEINEAYYGDYMKAVKKVYTKANTYDKHELQSSQEDLARDLRNQGFPDNITATKIPKHPNFDKLKDDHKDDILKITGTGRTPNAKFVKDFVAMLPAFKYTGYDENDGRSLEERIYSATEYMSRLKKKDIRNLLYSTWNNLGYTKTSEIKKTYNIKTFGEIYDELTDDEVAYIWKFSKPYIERFISNNFTDNQIESYIKYEVGNTNKDSDQYRMSGMSWTQDGLKKPFEYIKKLILSGKYIDWDKFKVIKLEFLDSEHSDVVSSSFSTTYYYTAEIKIENKTFKLPKFRGGSTYFSGGWN